MDAIVDLAWAMGWGIVLVFGSILLVAGLIVLTLNALGAAMNHKVKVKDRQSLQVLQQRAIETHRRAELNAGTQRIQATIDEVVVIKSEVQ